MEDVLNTILVDDLRGELLRLWKLFPRMPIPMVLVGMVVWPTLRIDVSRYQGGFLYYADDDNSQDRFYQRLEEFK